MCKFSNGKSLILQLSLCGSSCLWRVFENLFFEYYFWLCQSSDHARVVSILRFWIYQGSQYDSGSEYSRVLNISVLLRVLKMPEYTWIIPEKGRMNMNRFYFTFSHCNPLSSWTSRYLFQRSQKTRYMKMFSWRDKLSFFL